MKEYDVVILGSGIAGMTAAIYLKRADLNICVIENDTPGGELNKIWKVGNYPGYESIDGPTLAYNIFNQVSELGVEYIYDNIDSIDTTNNIINIKDNKLKYKYLLVATGRRPRGLGLPNEDKLIGKGISYCALCDGNLYKDRDVVIVGGGNTALNDAIYLSNICKKVTIVHRSNEYNGERSTIEKTYKDNIDRYMNANLVKYNLKNDEIVSVTLDNKKEIPCSGVFLAVGSIPNSELLDVDKNHGYIKVDNNYKTSIDNIYAVGDVIDKKIYQLTTASGDATIAACNIIDKLK